MSDEKRPITKNETPKEVEQDVPLTKEMLIAQMQRLTERARAVGLNPIHTMARTYTNRFLGILDGLLSSLGSDDKSKKKEE